MKRVGDQLAIAKETGRRLGMGTNMYPSSSLLGQDKDESIASLPVDELIEKADGFAGVFPGRLCFHVLVENCWWESPICVHEAMRSYHTIVEGRDY